ncbi:MAG TPA: class II glutamine amidotransferase [Isosphaeraceae bacterium]|jgi:glutamine amidotransferase
MCELMAMSFAAPISADFSIRAFAPSDDENPDGWGLAWYPDQSLALVKEPRKWRESRHAGFLEANPHLSSRIYLAHVREKSRGGPPTHADTHPFGRELMGREYAFAHNGTLADPVYDLPLGPAHPLGQTDSEHAFCHLLRELAARGRHLDAEDDWRWLHASLARLNRLGTLNVLLADGRRLFCYHDAAGWKGLCFRPLRFSDRQARHFGDVDLTFDLEADAVNRGVVVASRPLGRGAWPSFRLGELLVLQDGAVCFSSHRDRLAAEFAPAAAGAARAARDRDRVPQAPEDDRFPMADA